MNEMDNAKEYLEEKGIHPTEPIYWDLGKTTIELHDLLEDYHQSKLKTHVVLADVSDRRELLIAFIEWATENNTTHWLDTNPEIVDGFLKSNS